MKPASEWIKELPDLKIRTSETISSGFWLVTEKEIAAIQEDARKHPEPICESST